MSRMSTREDGHIQRLGEEDGLTRLQHLLLAGDLLQKACAAPALRSFGCMSAPNLTVTSTHQFGFMLHIVGCSKVPHGPHPFLFSVQLPHVSSQFIYVATWAGQQCIVKNLRFHWTGWSSSSLYISSVRSVRSSRDYTDQRLTKLRQLSDCLVVQLQVLF